MALVRRLLAWLLLAALPLQGFAAAAMPACGKMGPAAQLAAELGHPLMDPRDPAHGLGPAQADPHAGHHRPGHARHAAMADPGPQAAAEPAHQAAAEDHPTAAAEHHADAAASEAAEDASAHGCGACAAACHAVALTGDSVTIAPLPAPAMHRAEPVRRFDSRPPPVPDKPPRA